MTKPKHTPGPWFVRKYDDNMGQHPDRSPRPRVCYRIGVPIENENWAVELAPTAKAVCMIPECQGGAVDAANARLISAAPDLLAALKWLIEFEQFQKQDRDDPAIAKVWAAICKAEGTELKVKK